MNKKGFTLVELLAAVTILAILSLVTITTITSFLKKGQDDLYQKQLNNIKLAAKAWVSDNKDTFNTKKCHTLTIQDLKDSNYIDDNIKNPVDGKPINEFYIKITKENKRFNYELGEDNELDACYTEYEVGREITINNEIYNVIADSGKKQDYVTLLKQQPLTVDEVNRYGGVGTENNHVNMYNSYTHESFYHQAYDYGDTNHTGGMTYYTSTDCGSGSDSNETFSGCTAEYDSSDIKYVVDAWASSKFTNNELKEVDGYSARLVEKDELITIGYPSCSLTGIRCELESTTPSWIWSPNYEYWTMSKVDNSRVRSVFYTGQLYFDEVGKNIIAVRPVINVYKDALEGGNNNE